MISKTIGTYEMFKNAYDWPKFNLDWSEQHKILFKKILICQKIYLQTLLNQMQMICMKIENNCFKGL